MGATALQCSEAAPRLAEGYPCIQSIGFAPGPGFQPIFVVVALLPCGRTGWPCCEACLTGFCCGAGVVDLLVCCTVECAFLDLLLMSACRVKDN